MRQLIYITVSRTDIYREMCCLCVQSLRAAGRYRGEIQVMCNLIDERLAPIADLARLRICDMNCDVKDERMEGLSFIDGNQYDAVLNLDCDIMALQDIAPLFEGVEGVRWFDEPWGYLGTYEQMYTYYLTEAEMRRYAWCHTINVGHFGVSGTWLSRLYLAWKRMLLSKDHIMTGVDQAAFNAVLRRGIIPGRPFDRGLICNASKTPEARWRESAIIHFAGYGEQRMAKMRGLAS